MAVGMRMLSLCHGSLSSVIPSSVLNSSMLIKLDFLSCCMPVGKGVRSLYVRSVSVKWRKLRNIGLINMENRSVGI